MEQMAMKILALDTALDACSVAISDGDSILAFSHEERTRGHAETLLPTIKSLMKQSGLSFNELDMIAVSVGPGTFTGLRIGLAAARGLAIAAQIPCTGITTLTALAASVSPEIAKGRPILPVIDARRKEIYTQTFIHPQSASFPAATNEARAVPVTRMTQAFPNEDFLLIGSGIPLLQTAGLLNTAQGTLLDMDPNPDARLIAALARAQGIPPKGTPPAAPVYLRAPDAKLPGGINPKVT